MGTKTLLVDLPMCITRMCPAMAFPDHIQSIDWHVLVPAAQVARVTPPVLLPEPVVVRRRGRERERERERERAYICEG